ncbi:MAG: nicotinate-nucleotide adenylyltransferase [Nitrospinota bacterium]|nr:nicotinate-nucleotide adenylyltransferase [Nitrospinota bacterium]
MRIGVLGGSFNPVHLGHLLIAQETANLLEMDQVHLVVAAVPPHKEQEELMDAEARFEMVQLACRNNPLLHPSRVELDRKGPSFTIDTMRQFVDEYGPDCHFITGQDAMEDISTWKSALTLLKTVNFVVTARYGYDQSTLAQFIQATLSARYHNLKFHDIVTSHEGRLASLRVSGASTVINILKTPRVEISSSDIRARLAAGRTVKYLVPEDVERYLNDEKPFGKNIKG